MRILVSGANGFVGSALTRRLRRCGNDVVGAVRHAGGDGEVAIGNLNAHTDWLSALQGVDQVVHLAARVHVMHEQSVDPLAEFRSVNVDGTLNLAQQAALAGVKRFIFVSSIKVNGEYTRQGAPFTAADTPAPSDPYGISKYEAEQALKGVAARTRMEIVIIRPPLVYGPGVKANFAALMRWVARGWPLPLGAVNTNQRSLVALDNLVDLIMTCMVHPAAAQQTFLVSDGEDLSTAELVRRIGRAQGVSARLLPIPLWLLRSAAALLRKSGAYQRLCGSLQLDIAKTRRMLDWMPPVSVDEGLRRVVKGRTL